MKPIIRNILAAVAGWLVGAFVNGGIIQIGMTINPIDVDPNDMEAMANFFKNAGSEYFVFPFIAHAAGTLFGAFTAALISKNRKVTVALIIGGLFFIGGLLMILLWPAPTWFVAMDLVAAYVPMALLGALLAKSLRRKR